MGESILVTSSSTPSPSSSPRGPHRRGPSPARVRGEAPPARGEAPLAAGEIARALEGTRWEDVRILAGEDDETYPRGGGRGARRLAARREKVTVLHEDPSLVCVSKPAGLPVLKERWVDGATLLGWLKDAYPGEWIGLAHRIDRDASGVVAAARGREALRFLARQFRERTVEKTYLALVDGEPADDHGVIDLPLGLDRKRPGRMRATATKGRPSRTRWRVVERFRDWTFLEVRPETGRQHQIRVHLAAVGYPLAVDPLYGRRERLLLSQLKGAAYRPKRGAPERPLLARLPLHALRLSIASPADPSRPVVIEAPIPRDLTYALKALRKYRAVRSD